MIRTIDDVWHFEVWFQRIVDLAHEIDLIIAEYNDLYESERKNMPKIDLRLIDPVTGKPMEHKRRVPDGKP